VLHRPAGTGKILSSEYRRTRADRATMDDIYFRPATGRPLSQTQQAKYNNQSIHCPLRSICRWPTTVSSRHCSLRAVCIGKSSLPPQQPPQLQRQLIRSLRWPAIRWRTRSCSKSYKCVVFLEAHAEYRNRPEGRLMHMAAPSNIISGGAFTSAIGARCGDKSMGGPAHILP
jgi:hypothetical protein